VRIGKRVMRVGLPVTPVNRGRSSERWTLIYTDRRGRERTFTFRQISDWHPPTWRHPEPGEEVNVTLGDDRCVLAVRPKKVAP
jgi:hypothetical protein